MRLFEVLNRLALPASEQVKYLTQLGVADSVDELALEFDDIYRPLEHMLDSLGNGAVAALCRQVDTALQSDNLEWGFDGLYSADWDKIRRLASRAIRSIGACDETRRNE